MTSKSSPTFANLCNKKRSKLDCRLAMRLSFIESKLPLPCLKCVKNGCTIVTCVASYWIATNDSWSILQLVTHTCAGCRNLRVIRRIKMGVAHYQIERFPNKGAGPNENTGVCPRTKMLRSIVGVSRTMGIGKNYQGLWRLGEGLDLAD